MAEIQPEDQSFTAPIPERPAVNEMSMVLPAVPDPANPRIEQDTPVVHENEPSLLDAVRVTKQYAYEDLGEILVDLVAGTGIKLFTDRGPQISMIRFEDEPLRMCLDRLAHLVSGSYEFADNALHFKVS